MARSTWTSRLVQHLTSSESGEQGHWEPRGAVIGAGLGGIVTAYKLKKAGIKDFTVFEQSAGPGGTWWDNSYPGAAVDLHAHMYSFSFLKHYDWSRSHPRQPELQRYCEDILDQFQLRRY